jgi:hypothetical protein
MSSKIILKKSGVLGKIPQPTDLAFGEVAINYADGKLYFKNTSSNVQSISAGALGVDSASTIALINEYVDSAWITDRVGPIPTQGVDSSSTIALINEYVDSAWITDRVGPIPTQGVDSSSTIALIDTYVDATYINALDVNAGTLDGQDGTYFLNYTNFTNTPTPVDSAFVSGIAAGTVSPTDSASVRAVVDSAFMSTLINNQYVATIVDSAYVALRVGDFANNFGTVAVVGDLSIDATTGGDTLTLVAGNGVDITTNVGQKRITIAATTSNVYDFGTITSPVEFTLDMGTL